MPYKNGLEHEPSFLSLGIAVYRDQRNSFFFFSISFKPLDVQCNITGSCNDGDPRAKVTKRSKQPIYTHLNVGQFYVKITSKT